MSAVSIEHLHKRFGDHVVLPDLSLDVAEGEFVVLLGPSGCGKTTALRCVAGLETASAGRISIGGAIVEDGGRGVSIPPQSRNLGFVFQHYALWPHMSVQENIAYPMRMRGVSAVEAGKRVGAMLEAMGLEDLEHRSPAELSGGQQQRVALARALIGAPRVLLLDEPLSNLDAQRRVSLRKQLRALHREIRTTAIYVTHDQSEALTLADRVVLMRDGRIEQMGTPQELFGRPANHFVADFLGYENIIPATVSRVQGHQVAIASAAWTGDLVIERYQPVTAGAAIEVAFRAANVIIHDSNDGSPLFSSRSMRIQDATFLGDTVEYTLAAGDHFIVARMAATKAFSGNMENTRRHVSIHPDNIVILAANGE